MIYRLHIGRTSTILYYDELANKTKLKIFQYTKTRPMFLGRDVPERCSTGFLHTDISIFFGDILSQVALGNLHLLKYDYNTIIVIEQCF
ncbi:MAG: hypothetical protein COV70_01010 [Parcubacteria group bacterium CG11_big_fil_rev_8_21_14_0_20_39_22]|nr:MAG: hypothetical protein COV70_01010 [Parcubacteria group bacterium CG11_big_fil_rev_8_21_14_0_20_39_22]